MAANNDHKAAIKNPALALLTPLIGEWKTVGKHPYFPDKTFHGITSYKWIEGGAFLLMHSATEEQEIPDGIAIFGSDDATGEFYMLYFDERKVSRKYQLAFKEDKIIWWRDSRFFFTTVYNYIL